MLCPNCHQEIESGYSFCHHCGSAVAGNLPRRPPSTVRIPWSGELREPNRRSKSRFLAVVGAALTNPLKGWKQDLGYFDWNACLSGKSGDLLARTVELTGLLANVFGLSWPEIRGAFLGSTTSNDPPEKRLADVEYLISHLLETFDGADAAKKWLKGASPSLHPATPADLLEKGEIDKVEVALEALDSGVFV